MKAQHVLCLLLAALWTTALAQIRRKHIADDPSLGEKREPAYLPYRDPLAVVNNRDRPPPQQDLKPQVQPFRRQQGSADQAARDTVLQPFVPIKATPGLQRDLGAEKAPPPPQPVDPQLDGPGLRSGPLNPSAGEGNQGIRESNQDAQFRAGYPHHQEGPQQHMETLLKKRADEQRTAQEMLFQQQDAIRKKMEEQQQQLAFQQQRQKPSGVISMKSGSNNQPDNVHSNVWQNSANTSNDQAPIPGRSDAKFLVPTKAPTPTPRRPTPRNGVVIANPGGVEVIANPGVVQGAGGAGSVVGDSGAKARDVQGASQNGEDAGDRFRNMASHKANVDEVPDAPNLKPSVAANDNSNNPLNQNVNPGLSDGFRRGMIKKVQGPEESNLNQARVEQNVPQYAFPPEQPVREVGGLNINWDWDDFSITFHNYGAAEMKVRRAPHATTGEPWPQPQYYTKKDTILTVNEDFEFVVAANRSCDIIEEAIERYKARIVQNAMEELYNNLQNAEGSPIREPLSKYGTPAYTKAPVIDKFSLKIRKPCSKLPTLESDESYDLVVKKASAYLWANEVWGLLRGLETLSQLIWRGPDGRLYVKESIISDYPRFPHRGILLDSSRHFIFKEVILNMMDAMEMNKMNVLHWHIVDDQSFPYQSEVFPELSKKGAYHPTFVYSLTDIAEFIEYGRMRGIRIMPEFDSPGHTYSWGLSRPDLLTQCYSGSSAVKGYLGPIDPVRNSTYKFLKTLFGEILSVFKDDFMHLGGDEVPLGCWQSNPDVTKFAEKLSQQHGLSVVDSSQSFYNGPSQSIRLVYEHYVNRLMNDIKDMGKKRANGIKFIMWQEVMNNDLKLPNDTLIQVWMGDMADVNRAISLGYNVLYSSCWYLDHVEYGVKWPKYYQCDPVDSSYGYNIDEKKVKGGEACLWSEYIDNENLIQVTWPRASAVAERLWSSKETRNLDEAGTRLSEHRCRMLRRGLPVGQVSGPDYCPKRGRSQGRSARSGCQGDGCKSADTGQLDVQSQIRVRSMGSKASDCSWLVQVGGNVTVLAIVAVIALFVLVTLTRSHGKLYQLRQCRHRTILIVFVGVLLIYFMCYTTIWMHVFEFSGSFHKKS